MDWPVFALLSASAPLKAIVGTSPVRVWMDTVPPGGAQQRPYITWAVVGGDPEAYLDAVPTIDNGRIQIDTWSADKDQCHAMAKLVRNIIEPHANMIGVPVSGYEPDTELYRYTLEFSFWTPRT